MDTDLTAHPWFFCGIGGSGMLPLALILRAQGAEIAGSDRSRDQGRTPEKFAWLEAQGIAMHPQDGTGIVSPAQTLVASAAVENDVPEVVRAAELGCRRMSRAELLAALFNRAPLAIAVGGTSGKSTVTGMLGWILAATGRDPTIMNGAVMKNFADADAPFASARVGSGEAFVSEVDESDGSIDDPDAELRIEPGSIAEGPTSISATLLDARDGLRHALRLHVPGRHNLANALAAVAGASAAGVAVAEAVAALGSFAGLARRFDVVGASPSAITVIDDFGHNPEKVAATLATLKAHPGRVLAFFQPHGYGPLRQMGAELAKVLATRLGPDDLTILSDPVYFGGTVDRSEGSERIVRLIAQAGGANGPRAEHHATRQACGDRLAALARPGDRIVIMGARDDTLTRFAKDLLARLP